MTDDDKSEDRRKERERTHDLYRQFTAEGGR